MADEVRETAVALPWPRRTLIRGSLGLLGGPGDRWGLNLNS